MEGADQTRWEVEKGQWKDRMVVEQLLTSPPTSEDKVSTVFRDLRRQQLRLVCELDSPSALVQAEQAQGQLHRRNESSVLSCWSGVAFEVDADQESKGTRVEDAKEERAVHLAKADGQRGVLGALSVSEMQQRLRYSE